MANVDVHDRTPQSIAGPSPPPVDALLSCKTDHVRLITKLLGAICLKERQAPLAGPLAWCQLSEQGLRFTTEESTSLQARVYLMADMFREYAYAEAEPALIGLNLGVVLECLRILDGKGGALSQPPSLFVRYQEESACLRLTLVEGIALTTCEISTLDNGLPSDHGGASVRQSCRLVLKAETLRDGLAELEWGEANQRDKVVQLRVGAAARTLTLTVRNADCGCEMTFPADAMAKADVERDVDESYSFAHLQAVSRALHSAEEACVRVMDNGELNVMMRLNEGGKQGFVEYFLAPLDVDLDDEGFALAGGPVARPRGGNGHSGVHRAGGDGDGDGDGTSAG
ncbi:hypothetical protein KFE25_011170 [Diacronema lutheri]|uniref:Checkpoint protein n=1 Tax=Diacronema lutheri TaxID=2081491 RepID=A0A8J5XAX7_DIALT|nr:hypothetical protein KFE25_011170 [Diacronema lutheri]